MRAREKLQSPAARYYKHAIYVARIHVHFRFCISADFRQTERVSPRRSPARYLPCARTNLRSIKRQDSIFPLYLYTACIA